MTRASIRPAGLAVALGAIALVLAVSVGRDTGAPGSAGPMAAGPGPGASVGPATGPAGSPTGPAGTPSPTAQESPPVVRAEPVPLASIRTIPYTGHRPDLAELADAYQHGFPRIAVDRRAGLEDWRLSRPDPGRVSGYAGSMSTVPGGTVALHLRSVAGPLRLDVFRMGRDDASHLVTLLGVVADRAPEARQDPLTGLVREDWPVATTLSVPLGWRSGVYLVRLTAADGAQAYVPFVVRPTAPRPFLVVVPTLTYAAYDAHGGASLYRRPGSQLGRATAVSFDRPFDHGWGAGDFFNLDFPLVVWLEDHGYDPAYATDVDVAREPALLTGARAVVFSGHAEYWTRTMRDAADAAQARGVSLLDLGSNAAFWQVRLAPGADGTPDRTILATKDAAIDPLRLSDPEGVSARFTELPTPRPAGAIFGQDFGGITPRLAPLVLGPDVAAFAPDSGLQPGDRLVGLLSREVDAASTRPGARLLGLTPTQARRGTGPLAPIVAGASLWVSPSGSRAFDAGTFDWSWGLDPRYAAGLTGFPATGFARLMARILDWAGVAPDGLASVDRPVGYHPVMPNDAPDPR